MKREFKGCCFYVQIALFCPTSELRSYHVAPYGTAFALRRKMLRGLLAKLKAKDERSQTQPGGAVGTPRPTKLGNYSGQ
jgi:hypothetical protein